MLFYPIKNLWLLQFYFKFSHHTVVVLEMESAYFGPLLHNPVSGMKNWPVQVSARIMTFYFYIKKGYKISTFTWLRWELGSYNKADTEM